MMAILTGPCEFSRRHLGELLSFAAEHCQLLPIRDAELPEDGRPRTYLRHDIDHSMLDALDVAALEAEHGVRSTYFVQLHSTFYDVMSEQGHGQLRRLVELGHEVGFHYDITYYRRTGQSIEAAFRRDLALLGDLVGQPVRSISRHDPSAAHLEPELLAKIRGAAPFDAYASPFFEQGRYISDSTGSFRSGCWCRHLGEGRKPPLQVLIHPIWWGEQAQQWQARLRSSAEREARQRVAAVDDIIDYYQRFLDMGRDFAGKNA
ncbi:MAG: hypothetical protein OEZ06_24665 [Myxococcales bacterium]|nr:hypothetical protein [Myxococcales bacterium]